MSASDDGTSQSFNFGFDFNFFGETFNSAYMASNGCLILGSLSTATRGKITVRNTTPAHPLTPTIQCILFGLTLLWVKTLLC